MSDVLPPVDRAPSAGPVGIGGWLIVPIVLMCGALIVGLLELPKFLGALSGARGLDSREQFFFQFEGVMNILITIVGPICLLILLFGKRRAFPKVYTVWGLTNLAFAVGHLVLARAVFPHAPRSDFFNVDTVGNIIRAVLLAGIWVVYMNVSQRVRNTFVN